MNCIFGILHLVTTTFTLGEFLSTRKESPEKLLPLKNFANSSIGPILDETDNSRMPVDANVIDDISLFFEIIKIRKRLGKSLYKVLSSEATNSSHHIKNQYIEEEVSSTAESNNDPNLEENLVQDFTSPLIKKIAAETTTDDQPPMALPLKQKSKYGVDGKPLKKKCPSFCHIGQNFIGNCYSRQECLEKKGEAVGSCCGDRLVCCQMIGQCGDTSSERVIHFQSPNFPLYHRGTVACDFELQIHQTTCAVRIDFVKVRLFGKLGGVCDVDQLLILNSVDGPTSAQCGDLSGYSTTAAVVPGQEQPFKLVIIIQNEGYYHWDIRLRQIHCTELSHFRRPHVCGSKATIEQTESFYQLLDLWKNSAWHTTNQYSDAVWWRDPGPTFNRFHYDAIKMALNNQKRFDLLQNAQDRIIGGHDAELHEFPWQVAIILKREFFCGGVLINDEYVLSAAHCFLTQDTPVEDLVVFLGDHDLTTSNDTINVVRGVKLVHFHAHFHALLLSNDIALIQLDRPVAFNQRIRPICLPSQDAAVLGRTGTVAGWGITIYPDGKPNSILQKLDVQIMSNEFCESALNEDLGPGNLCAVARGQQGTCFGDSGGPLTMNLNGKDTLIGIVSFGITGCAVSPGLPDLYTRVSEYLQWIDISAIKYIE